MEFSKIEVAVVAETLAECANDQVQELDELQLALVGGGAGEAVLA